MGLLVDFNLYMIDVYLIVNEILSLGNVVLSDSSNNDRD